MASVWWLAGAFICGTCSVVGCFGNGLTIAIFIKFSEFRNIVGLFIFSLAVSDFLCSIYVTSANAAYFYAHSGKWYFSKGMCVLNNLICYGTVTFSAFLICIIAMNRCVKICQKHEIYTKIFCKRNVSIGLVLIWVFSFGTPLLVSFNIGGYMNHNEESGICNVKFTKLWIVYVGTFAASVVVIIICYVHIYINVVRSRAASKQHSMVPTIESKVNYKLLKMLIVTTITYILSITIPLAVGMISYFQNNIRNHNNTPEQVFFYKIPVFVAVIINPINYGITNAKYREAYKKIILGTFNRFYKTIQNLLA